MTNTCKILLCLIVSLVWITFFGYLGYLSSNTGRDTVPPPCMIHHDLNWKTAIV